MKKDMKTKSLKKNIIMNYVRTVTGVLFPLITLPYASRILLTDGMGKVNFVASIIVYLQMIASLGINTYAIREGTKVRENKEKISRFSSEVLCINMVSMCVSYVIVLILMLIPVFKPYRSSLLIYSMVVIFGVIGVEWLYSIYEDFEYITWRALAFQIISLILLFIMVRSEKDVNNYILITVLSTAGSSICNILHSRKYVNWFTHIKDYQLLKHIKPIMIIFGTSIASKIYLNMDTIMIGLIKTDSEVGLYSAAIKLNAVLYTLITAVSGVMLPRLSYCLGQNKRKEYESLVNLSMQYMMFAIIPVIVGLVLIAPHLLRVFCGKAFVNAAVTMRIMLPNLFCSILNGFVAYQILVPNNGEKKALLATIAGAVTNLLLNSIFIPLSGRNGAAIATVITEIVVFIICIYNASKIMSCKKIFSGIWQYFMASTVFLLVKIVIMWMSITNDILVVILEILLGGIGYVIILIVMKNQFVFEMLKMIKKK
ncbi:MAG: flippase [Clostridium sp.]|nr:flippase [Clostridium sp.]